VIFRVGIENNNEGVRSIAWALAHPGCFAYGANEKEALANLPAAIQAYFGWTGDPEASQPDINEIGLEVEDIWTAYLIDPSFERVTHGDDEVNAWFQHDWKPLTMQDIERGQSLLARSRTDLIHTLEELTSEQWAYQAVGERWDIAGIVNHIAAGERWYLDRLGLAFPRSEMPKDPLERIVKVRDLMNRVLPTLEGSKQVVGVDGEFWSPRKVLRRAVWHERDHTGHIRKLL